MSRRDRIIIALALFINALLLTMVLARGLTLAQ
jgi:hypothetical protein